MAAAREIVTVLILGGKSAFAVHLHGLGGTCRKLRACESVRSSDVLVRQMGAKNRGFRSPRVPVHRKNSSSTPHALASAVPHRPYFQNRCKAQLRSTMQMTAERQVSP